MAASMLAKLKHLRFNLLRKRPSALDPSASNLAAIAHIIDHPIEEELLPGDRLRHFHPTHPDELLDDRYKTITKLGSGAGSTVWLAENLVYEKGSPVPHYVSVKIGALDAGAKRELTALKLIANARPSHEGLSFIRTPIDDFQIEGPKGTYFCLVYQPMRETLLSFRCRFSNQKLPLPIFKLFTYCLLQALDYLHTECHLIHTDIKDDNVMVLTEDDDALEDFVAAQRRTPLPRHVRKDGRVTYLSQSNLGPVKGLKSLPELGDFDFALPGLSGNNGHLSAIQSHCYRAPEVLLGVPWSYSTDIWNLGLLMWNLLENVDLFVRPAGEDGEYDAHVHLAQMITLLGPPPEELVKRERLFRKYRLEHPRVNPQGRECESMNKFWGGPFFDDNGEMIRKDLLREGTKLADTVTELKGNEKEEFLDFAGAMLRWLPEERKTARELLKHSFFKSFYEHRTRVM